MKVQIKKKLLVNALEKMYDVSTKALLPDFNFSGKVTIEAQGSRVLFTSSNGCVTAQIEITETDDPGIANCDKGIFTVDSVKIRDSVRRIVTESSSTPIEWYDDGNVIVLRDSESKRKKLVKLPRENAHHKTSTVAVPDGESVFMETEYFLEGVKTVAPFETVIGYQTHYQVVCFHWIGKESRIICGDGGQFAIFTVPRHQKDQSKRELKRTAPCAQLDVVSSLVVDSSELEMRWKDKSVLWIKTKGVELIMKGLPNIDYVSYHNNAYRFDEAVAYLDIKISDLIEVCNLLGVLHDKEREDQGKIHSCVLEAPSSDGHVKFEITQKQGKFQCEYEIPATYYDLGTCPKFTAKYAHLFFDSPARASRHSYIRVYFMDKTKTLVSNARDVELGELDKNDIPLIKEEEDNCSISFFFAAIRDDEKDEDE